MAVEHKYLSQESMYTNLFALEFIVNNNKDNLMFLVCVNIIILVIKH